MFFIIPWEYENIFVLDSYEQANKKISNHGKTLHFPEVMDTVFSDKGNWVIALLNGIWAL